MNAAQKLARRAQRRERQIVGSFFQIAETVGMTPAQVATSAVVVYADVRRKPARVWAYNLNPAPELRTVGPRMTFACDRARLVDLWRSDRRDAHYAEDATLSAMLQNPPQEGFFWLLCIAGAPGDRTFSWSISMVAWSIYGASVETGTISREHALAIWHETDREQPGFWDRNSRENVGPLTDDERVRTVRAAWQHARGKERAN